ncbi:MAG: response regulator [Methyloligellaceae bacterium]
MTEVQARAVEILLVEDNDGDVFLTKKAFETAKIANNFHVAMDGEIALAMLRNEGEYADIPRPDLILLDINLPKKDGRAVLSEIRDDEELRRIPIVILSSSSTEQDVLKSYDLHANSYIVKPINLNSFQNIVSAIENFWFNLVVLPQR